LKRGRVLALLVVGAAGYVGGNWHALTLRGAGLPAATTLSPAENVALRFPEAPTGTVVVADAAGDVPTEGTSSISPTSSAMAFGGAQLALLSPEPMTGSAAAAVQPEPPAAMPVPDQVAALPVPGVRPVPRPMPVAPPPRADLRPKPALAPHAELKMPGDAGSRHANRQSFVLNDAQIASIKGRLHLTPDQERMWPSVEAALRSIAYAKAHDATRRGAAAAIASLDPDSVEVQGLKSAAVPLILSFSDEQKNEVRSLAHVMGLDQLAAQF
jgi:hypothetical protein